MQISLSKRSLVILMLLTTLIFTKSTKDNEAFKKHNLVNKVSKISLTRREFNCLVKNMYHEARGESKLGIALVGQVTLNRAISSKRDLCDVVYEPSQFSWTLEKPKEISNEQLIIVNEVGQALIRREFDIPHRFLHVKYFYNQFKIRAPIWTRKLDVVGSEGNHIFLAEKEVSYMKNKQ
jgi:N-acetylmuramoyl-L-alanine amidase